MKKVVFFLGVTGLLCSGFLLLVNYTQKQVNDTMDELVNQVVWGDFKPISFGDALYAHVHGIIDAYEHESRRYAGMYTPSSYKNGMRKQVAENPQMLYAALSVFGKTALQRFEKKLIAERDRQLKEGSPFSAHSPQELEKRDPDWWLSYYYSYSSNVSKDSVYARQQRRYEASKKRAIVWTQRMENLTVSKFLCEQKEVMEKYEQLVTELLKLPNRKLNTFIAEVGWEQNYCDDCSAERLAKKTQAWLVKNKLIEKMPSDNYNYGQRKGEQIWYLGKYPVDMLLFTYRINKDYPEWTPRKILTEVKTFSAEVKKLIPYGVCQDTTVSQIAKKLCEEQDQDEDRECPEETTVSFERKVSVHNNVQKAAVYPNPTNGMVKIAFANDSIDCNVQILNTIGQVVHETVTTKRITEIDLHGLRPGMYFIRITGKNTAETHGIIKQ